MVPENAAVGTRISLSGYHGTIRYVGEVDGTTGIWLGVEWDNPQRGKHNGTKDGKQYFSCGSPNSGSFIRPSAHINYGTSFLRALISKYQTGVQVDPHEIPRPPGMKIEVVGMEKIRSKLSNLQNLRDVGLDGENVAISDPPGEIQKLCPNLRGVDLSLNLLPSWDVVASIAAELPTLERLALNHNRLQPAQDAQRMATAFPRLANLQLNCTMMTWSEMQQVTALMPNLRHIEFGYNRLTTLDISPLPQSTVQVLNLDGNECCSWLTICRALQCYTSLQRLILTANHIESIEPPLDCDQNLCNLRHLSLAFNCLKAWSDIDTIFRWCSAIQTLSLMGNPLVEDPDLGRYWRQITIAKIPTLVTLDSTTITNKERIDSELFYVSYIVQHGPSREEDRIREHPRWGDLCAEYGPPEKSGESKLKNKLSSRLISMSIISLPMQLSLNSAYLDVAVCHASIRPSTPDYDHSESTKFTLRVLPSMSFRALRSKLRKVIKPSLLGGNVQLWLKMADGQIVPIDTSHDDQELEWLGVEDGSVLVFYIDMEYKD